MLYLLDTRDLSTK